MCIVRAHASETALLEIIVAIEDTLQKVMLVGHNPGLTVLTNKIGDGAISNFGKIDVSPVLTYGRRTTRHKQ
jgi:phosphohistidine phosphatase SixA